MRWGVAAAFGAVALLAAPHAHAQGRIVVDTLQARGLEGNRAGDPSAREVYTYLPPSYATDRTRRFPVLYLLHGMTSHPREWLDGSYQGLDLRAAMDSLVHAGGTEFLIVMPHADNRFGGTFYVNSPAFGRWDDVIARELVAFIDTRYRTHANRRDRGLGGQSMGGFGALWVAQGHADTFGSVYAMSPCCLDLVGDLAPDSDVWKWAAPGAAVTRPQAGRARLARAMAAAFAPPGALRNVAPGDSPDSTNLLAPLPFVVDATGVARADGAVLERWRELLPVHRLTRDPSPIRRSCAVVIEFGISDEIASVPAGARAYSAALTRAGIKHTLSAFDGKHVDRTRERFERHVLPFFSDIFSGRAGVRAAPPGECASCC